MAVRKFIAYMLLAGEPKCFTDSIADTAAEVEADLKTLEPLPFELLVAAFWEFSPGERCAIRRDIRFADRVGSVVRAPHYPAVEYDIALDATEKFSATTVAIDLLDVVPLESPSEQTEPA
jgi:hypothetical protein